MLITEDVKNMLFEYCENNVIITLKSLLNTLSYEGQVKLTAQGNLRTNENGEFKLKPGASYRMYSNKAGLYGASIAYGVSEDNTEFPVAFACVDKVKLSHAELDAHKEPMSLDDKIIMIHVGPSDDRIYMKHITFVRELKEKRGIKK